MTTLNFNTSNSTFRHLLGNGLTYHVPRFQRDYSWTEEEWDDLWQDIVSLLSPDGEPAHYMGYLVLQTDDHRTFEIIDGQQRLTTLSLLVLATLKNIQRLIDNGVESPQNQQRLDQLRNSYIGFVDPVTLVSRAKLTLNKNNEAYYQNYLVPLERLPKRGLKASEHLLRKSFEWFQKAIEERYASQNDGAEFARFIDVLADKLLFTVITVTDELNAFKVFETLNARGVRLSSTDLLKNYLFSIIHRAGTHDHEMNALEERWEKIIDHLGSEQFPQFLRIHWNSRQSFVRNSDLFKTIRRHIKDRGQVFQLLREMEEDAEIFAALSQPEDALWDKVQSNYVAELNLFHVRQPYALLLAVKRSVSNAEFTTILRACSIISFRYNTIGSLTANDQERVYNTVAKAITADKLRNSKEILHKLRPIYLSDDRFKSAFTEKQFKTTSSRNRRLVRYILFRIESHLANQEYDFGSDKYTIEHILPEKPNEEWTEFTEPQVEQFVYRLGNMTLLQAKANRHLGNGPFGEKRAVYAESEFRTTQNVAEENSEWTVTRITRRQEQMARQAAGIWQITQLAK